MRTLIKRIFSDIKFYYSIIAILLVAVTLVQISFKISDDSVGYMNSGKPFDTEIIQAAAPSEIEFGKNKGMISIKCTGLGKGCVYVFVNNTMKANITSSELKTLKVKKGDVLIVKGRGLNSNATVTIEAAVGNIDTSIVGVSVSVGNLGKYLISIK